MMRKSVSLGPLKENSAMPVVFWRERRMSWSVGRKVALAMRSMASK
jgi:hypothetical protein